MEIDGNDFENMECAFAQFHETREKPFAIVMKTVKGKGISFMEGRAEWHGKAPNDQEYQQALAEINACMENVEAM